MTLKFIQCFNITDTATFRMPLLAAFHIIHPLNSLNQAAPVSPIRRRCTQELWMAAIVP